jgi:hypothetical protein
MNKRIRKKAQKQSAARWHERGGTLAGAIIATGGVTILGRHGVTGVLTASGGVVGNVTASGGVVGAVTGNASTITATGGLTVSGGTLAGAIIATGGVTILGRTNKGGPGRPPEICPVCKPDGEASTVSLVGESTTLMGFSPGQPDPNWKTFEYCCSRGHRFDVVKKHGQPDRVRVRGCGHGPCFIHPDDA